MTKQEFDEWKNSLVTKEIFAGLQEQQKKIEYYLTRSQEIEPTKDALKRGYILAVDDLINVQFDEETPVEEIPAE